MKKAVLGFLIAAAFVSLGDVNLPNTSTIADIQAAINSAQPGEVITLADGTYLFDAPLTIEKGVTLTGSHRDKCILQGSGKIDSISAMKIADAGACVKNLTITKVDSSAGDYNYHGIAVWITAGLFTQSRVTECKTSNGNRAAGVSLESDTAIMTHCIIDHNTASGGNGVGGVRIHKGGGTMANCLVWANTGGSGDYGVGGVSVKPDAWKRLLASDEISITGMANNDGRWGSYKPFSIYISKDDIDPWVSYRLIPPGYQGWKDMGIYQRCLENYTQKTIINNASSDNNCMNCHSYPSRNPHKMLFHARADHGGTFLIQDGEIEKLNTKTDSTISALVYPYWHPSGDYIAYSTNSTRQIFHSRADKRIGKSLEAKVTLTVPAGRRVRQYAKGEGIWKTLEAADGTYTVALAAGDGELILID